MYDEGGGIINRSRTVYANNLGNARAKGGKSEFFKVDSGVREGFSMTPLDFEKSEYSNSENRINSFKRKRMEIHWSPGFR